MQTCLKRKREGKKKKLSNSFRIDVCKEKEKEKKKLPNSFRIDVCMK